MRLKLISTYSLLPRVFTNLNNSTKLSRCCFSSLENLLHTSKSLSICTTRSFSTINEKVIKDYLKSDSLQPSISEVSLRNCGFFSKFCKKNSCKDLPIPIKCDKKQDGKEIKYVCSKVNFQHFQKQENKLNVDSQVLKEAKSNKHVEKWPESLPKTKSLETKLKPPPVCNKIKDKENKPKYVQIFHGDDTDPFDPCSTVGKLKLEDFQKSKPKPPEPSKVQNKPEASCMCTDLNTKVIPCPVQSITLKEKPISAKESPQKVKTNPGLDNICQPKKPLLPKEQLCPEKKRKDPEEIGKWIKFCRDEFQKCDKKIENLKLSIASESKKGSLKETEKRTIPKKGESKNQLDIKSSLIQRVAQLLLALLSKSSKQTPVKQTNTAKNGKTIVPKKSPAKEIPNYGPACPRLNKSKIAAPCKETNTNVSKKTNLPTKDCKPNDQKETKLSPKVSSCKKEDFNKLCSSSAEKQKDCLGDVKKVQCKTIFPCGKNNTTDCKKEETQQDGKAFQKVPIIICEKPKKEQKCETVKTKSETCPQTKKQQPELYCKKEPQTCQQQPPLQEKNKTGLQNDSQNMPCPQSNPPCPETRKQQQELYCKKEPQTCQQQPPCQEENNTGLQNNSQSKPCPQNNTSCPETKKEQELYCKKKPETCQQQPPCQKNSSQNNFCSQNVPQNIPSTQNPTCPQNFQQNWCPLNNGFPQNSNPPGPYQQNYQSPQMYPFSSQNFSQNQASMQLCQCEMARNQMNGSNQSVGSSFNQHMGRGNQQMCPCQQMGGGSAHMGVWNQQITGYNQGLQNSQMSPQNLQYNNMQGQNQQSCNFPPIQQPCPCPTPCPCPPSNQNNAQNQSSCNIKVEKANVCEPIEKSKCNQDSITINDVDKCTCLVIEIRAESVKKCDPPKPDTTKTDCLQDKNDKCPKLPHKCPPKKHDDNNQINLKIKVISNEKPTCEKKTENNSFCPVKEQQCKVKDAPSNSSLENKIGKSPESCDSINKMLHENQNIMKNILGTLKACPRKECKIPTAKECELLESQIKAEEDSCEISNKNTKCTALESFSENKNVCKEQTNKKDLCEIKTKPKDSVKCIDKQPAEKNICKIQPSKKDVCEVKTKSAEVNICKEQPNKNDLCEVKTKPKDCEKSVDKQPAEKNICKIQPSKKDICEVKTKSAEVNICKEQPNKKDLCEVKTKPKDCEKSIDKQPAEKNICKIQTSKKDICEVKTKSAEVNICKEQPNKKDLCEVKTKPKDCEKSLDKQPAEKNICKIQTSKKDICEVKTKSADSSSICEIKEKPSDKKKCVIGAPEKKEPVCSESKQQKSLDQKSEKKIKNTSCEARKQEICTDKDSALKCPKVKSYESHVCKLLNEQCSSLNPSANKELEDKMCKNDQKDSKSIACNITDNAINLPKVGKEQTPVALEKKDEVKGGDKNGCVIGEKSAGLPKSDDKLGFNVPSKKMSTTSSRTKPSFNYWYSLDKINKYNLPVMKQQNKLLKKQKLANPLNGYAPIIEQKDPLLENAVPKVDPILTYKICEPNVIKNEIKDPLEVVQITEPTVLESKLCKNREDPPEDDEECYRCRKYRICDEPPLRPKPVACTQKYCQKQKKMPELEPPNCCKPRPKRDCFTKCPKPKDLEKDLCNAPDKPCPKTMSKCNIKPESPKSVPSTPFSSCTTRRKEKSPSKVIEDDIFEGEPLIPSPPICCKDPHDSKYRGIGPLPCKKRDDFRKEEQKSVCDKKMDHYSWHPNKIYGTSNSMEKCKNLNGDEKNSERKDDYEKSMRKKRKDEESLKYAGSYEKVEKELLLRRKSSEYKAEEDCIPICSDKPNLRPPNTGRSTPKTPKSCPKGAKFPGSENCGSKRSFGTSSSNMFTRLYVDNLANDEKFCNQLGRTFNLSKCHNCNNDEYFPKKCVKEKKINHVNCSCNEFLDSTNSEKLIIHDGSSHDSCCTFNVPTKQNPKEACPPSEECEQCDKQDEKKVQCCIRSSKIEVPLAKDCLNYTKRLSEYIQPNFDKGPCKAQDEENYCSKRKRSCEEEECLKELADLQCVLSKLCEKIKQNKCKKKKVAGKDSDNCC